MILPSYECNRYSEMISRKQFRWRLDALGASGNKTFPEPTLTMLIDVNWLTHDFWTRTGGWEFDRSHGDGTSSPSHWQQVKEQAPKHVGWMMCFLLMTLLPIQKLCVNNIYIYVYICIPYMSSVIGRIYIYIYIYTAGVSFSIGEAAPHHVL